MQTGLLLIGIHFYRYYSIGTANTTVNKRKFYLWGAHPRLEATNNKETNKQDIFRNKMSYEDKAE